MRSIRSRLILGTASATVLILVVCGWAVYLSVRAFLLREFDGALLSRARALSSMIEVKDSRLKLELDLNQMPEFQRRQHPDYFQLWQGPGRVVARSPSLAGRELAFIQPGPGGVARESIPLPGGQAGRAIAIAFEPQQEDEGQSPPLKGPRPILVVAGNTIELDRTLAQLAWLLLGVCGAATLASAASMIWIVRRGLKPVKALAGQIARMDGSDLSRRVGLEAIPDELMPITQRLNELLDRLQAAFAREKSFSADVAHELRTPLAGLGTSLEICISRPREPGEYQRVIAKCLVATQRMNAMVDNLLMLARVEARQVRVTCEPVAIEPLVRECWAPFAAPAAQRALQVQFNLGPDCVSTDREKLRLVLRNLFDNAVSYTDAGGHVGVEANSAGGRFALSVANSGSALSQQEADRAFDRFWRGDAARANTGLHCGLGLTLCRRIAETLGGCLRAKSQDGEFRIDLSLPAPHRDDALDRQALPSHNGAT